MIDQQATQRSKVRALRAAAHDLARRSAELRREVEGALRDMRDLAARSLRNRRQGDGLDPS